jgi:hypothetical protein
LLFIIGILSIIIIMSLDPGGELIPRFMDPQWWNPNIY